MIGRATDAVNLYLARRLTRRFVPTADKPLSEALTASAGPVELYAYLTNLLVAWSSLVLPACLFALATAYIGDQIDRNRGNRIGLAIGMAPVVFCLVGAADAAWRRRFAKAARRRYLNDEFDLDERGRRFMQIARFNDRTIAVQGLLAAILSWRIW